MMARVMVNGGQSGSWHWFTWWLVVVRVVVGEVDDQM